MMGCFVREKTIVQMMRQFGQETKSVQGLKHFVQRKTIVQMMVQSDQKRSVVLALAVQTWGLGSVKLILDRL